MTIPFAKPYIDDAVIREVNDCLQGTGWLTSGPKVLELEQALLAYTGAKGVVAVNSWTSGAMMALRWFGIGPGDEVIVPAYTYAATALCAMNLGAKVIMVDVDASFCLDPQQLTRAITPNTKAVIPVDLGGYPADYPRIKAILDEHPFLPANARQERLGRPLLLADAAHSPGAKLGGQAAGTLADITVFSFHSVKNITTGEGGALCLFLPDDMDALEDFRLLRLNGQTKSAFEKNQPGAWRYDIVLQGMKANMPDLCAAVGLAQLRQYAERLLPERKRIFRLYNKFLKDLPAAILPPDDQAGRISANHLYLLRLQGLLEQERDQLIAFLGAKGVGTNVHYQPLPLLTLFRQLGYRMEDFPTAFSLYQNEISLPIYNGLSDKEVEYVVERIREFF